MNRVRALVAALALAGTLAVALPAYADDVTGCEHSSNFHAPPGCPDDGSGPQIDIGTALAVDRPEAQPAPEVVVSARFTG